MLQTILLVAIILVSLAMTALVLLQRSEGGALGMGGGPSGFMTARGAGDLLTRTTSILGAIFFILSIALTVVVAQGRGADSVVDRLKVDALNPEALNRALEPPPAAPGATPPAGLQAPAPQVNTAPSLMPMAPPAAAPAPGAGDSASRVLGIQTAPQAPAQ